MTVNSHRHCTGTTELKDSLNVSVSKVHKRPPGWLPDAALHYLLHTETGAPIRAIARASGVHASTISRQIRKVESKRDDPLIDTGLLRLGTLHFPTQNLQFSKQDTDNMTAMSRIDLAHSNQPSDHIVLSDESRLALRRMAETGSVMAVAAEMENAVIMRTPPGGEAARTAVVSREVAETLALRDLITCISQGRISRYEITAAGRAALKRDAETHDDTDTGFDEAISPFTAQHGDWDKRPQRGRCAKPRPRINLAESPLAVLARRKDKDGTPFLNADLVAAGERLREDFELAQMGPRVGQNWDRFLTAGTGGNVVSGGFADSGSCAARDRVTAALSDLGPGLGDVVLRTCCYLEGMETTERELGWSARSGKIVLRIALQRLHRHYEEAHQGRSPLIG